MNKKDFKFVFAASQFALESRRPLMMAVLAEKSPGSIYVTPAENVRLCMICFL